MRNAEIDQRPALAGTKTLVIGWGNDLLRDDGAGRRVARQIAARHPAEIDVLDVHQLTPELALPLSQFGRAIFVDAYAAREGDTVRTRKVDAARLPDRPAIGHTGRPDDLLRMAALLYGAHPEAWLVAVPACAFEPGDALSRTARAGIRSAIVEVERLARSRGRAEDQTQEKGEEYDAS